MSDEVVESNKVLQEKQMNSRSELRLHQFKQVDLASGYANAALRTTIIINAGALALIPTFISSFQLEGVNSSSLSIGMICFVSSILLILLTYVLAYLSGSLAARSTIEHAETAHFVIAIDHNRERGKEVPQDWVEKEGKHRKKYERFNFWTNFFEVVAVMLSLCALAVFFVGSIKCIKAIPVSVLTSQTESLETEIEPTATPTKDSPGDSKK